MGFFDWVDSKISGVVSGISYGLHPLNPDQPITNDEFLQILPPNPTTYKPPGSSQSGMVILGIAALLLLIMKKK